MTDDQQLESTPLDTSVTFTVDASDVTVREAIGAFDDGPGLFYSTVGLILHHYPQLTLEQWYDLTVLEHRALEAIAIAAAPRWQLEAVKTLRDPYGPAARAYAFQALMAATGSPGAPGEETEHPEEAPE